MKRFYPEYVPPFPHEPDIDSFDIIKISDIVGEGIVSKKVFCPGEIVFGFTGFVLDAITQYTLRAPSGQHIHDPFFMGKVLHSCDPNTSCNMQSRLYVALKEILPGDLITMDYEETEIELFKSFPCQCREANCRGVIGQSKVLIKNEEPALLKGKEILGRE